MADNINDTDNLTQSAQPMKYAAYDRHGDANLRGEDWEVIKAQGKPFRHRASRQQLTRVSTVLEDLFGLATAKDAITEDNLPVINGCVGRRSFHALDDIVHGYVPRQSSALE